MAELHIFVALRMLVFFTLLFTTSHGGKISVGQGLFSTKPTAENKGESLAYDYTLGSSQVFKRKYAGNEDSGGPPTSADTRSFDLDRNGENTRARGGVNLSPEFSYHVFAGDNPNRKSRAANAYSNETPETKEKIELTRTEDETNYSRDETEYKTFASTLKCHSHFRANRKATSNHKHCKYLCGPSNKCICILAYYTGSILVKCSYAQLEIFPNLEVYNVWSIDVSYNKLSQFSFSSLMDFPDLQSVDLTHNWIQQISVLDGEKLATTNLRKLNLNENKIKDINDVPFHVFIHLRELSLSKNCLTHISYKPFFGLEFLDFLDLSHNEITRIEESAFNRLKRLRTLRLDHNVDLAYVNLSQNLFQNLTSLKILSIQGNSNATIDRSYPDAALAKLSNLRELAIDGLGGGAELGSGLRHLKHLENLIIGSSGNCLIRNIASSFFQNVQRLKRLVFAGCNFTINPEAFRNLNNLINYTIEFPGEGYEFCTAFDDLRGLNASVETLALVGFIKGAIKCRSLCVEKSRYIKLLKSLKGLYLDYNYISFIDGDFLENLPKSLEKLSVRGNTFTLADDSWNKLHNFTSLHEIDVREQNLHFSPDKMAYWSLGRGTEESRCKQFLDELNFTPQFKDNHFYRGGKSNTTDDKGSSEENNECDTINEICIPPNLKCLSASGLTQFGKGLLFNNLSSNKLFYLDFSRSYITDWGNGKLPATVKYADLGHNFCNQLKENFFPENNSLIYLYIQNNYLGPVFSLDSSGSIFSRLKMLQKLNIAMNNIFYLPPSFFKGLGDLRFLNMTENKIELIDLDFVHTPNLKFMDLTKNSISWITRKSRNQLDAIAKKHELKIDLYDNPLPCTCSGIEFLKWLNDTLVGIVNGELLECETEDKVLVPMTNITIMIHDLEKRCLRDPKLIIITSFTCGLLVVVIVSGMLYKHRWKLIYVINTWLVKRCGFRAQDKDTSQRRYDAYVVYSEEDREFALDTMIDEMESKRGHLLCLEDRDFIPGTLNFNNITRAIQDSSRTLLLLSPEFVRSKELRYATLMALMEEYGGQNKREVMFLIFYKQVSDKDLTRDLLMLKKKDRYLDYPNQGDDAIKQSFWNRLSAEIGHTHTIKPQTGLQVR